MDHIIIQKHTDSFIPRHYKKIRIAVLITSHNRKEKTVSCLEALSIAFEQVSELMSDIYLVDDGCTDGTVEIIRIKFPKVIIIQGNGSLFWNRGMFLAWKRAATNKEYDFYLWLNDDTNLLSNSVSILLKDSTKNKDQSIICGICKSKYSDEISYSGFERNSHQIIKPNGKTQICYFFNGNVVLVPKYVFEKVGNLDPYFQHAFGDFDYGLRALKQNIFSYVSSEVVGFCEKNKLSTWCNPNITLFKRLVSFYSPLGVPPIQHLIYATRHWGISKAIKNFFSTHFRVLFPNLWLKK